MNKVAVIHVWGGTGNQLFLYSFGEYLRCRYGLDVFYDLSSYGTTDIRNLELRIVAGNLPEFKTKWYFFSRHKGVFRRLSLFIFKLLPYVHYEYDHFDESTLSKKVKIFYFDGYWQEKQYAEWLVNINPEFFKPVITIPSRIRTIASQLEGMDTTSIHIRRGDYLLPANAHLNVCNDLYYLRAVQNLSNKNDNVLVVFSDDIKWVKENLIFQNKTIYIEDKGESPFWYVYLMSKCHNHIISNSTFSWWGAFLDRNTNKNVIAPSRWRNDRSNPNLYYSEWSLIEV